MDSAPRQSGRKTKPTIAGKEYQKKLAEKRAKSARLADRQASQMTNKPKGTRKVAPKARDHSAPQKLTRRVITKLVNNSMKEAASHRVNAHAASSRKGTQRGFHHRGSLARLLKRQSENAKKHRIASFTGNMRTKKAENAKVKKILRRIKHHKEFLSSGHKKNPLANAIFTLQDTTLSNSARKKLLEGALNSYQALDVAQRLKPYKRLSGIKEESNLNENNSSNRDNRNDVMEGINKMKLP